MYIFYNLRHEDLIEDLLPLTKVLIVPAAHFVESQVPMLELLIFFRKAGAAL